MESKSSYAYRLCDLSEELHWWSWQETWKDTTEKEIIPGETGGS